MHKAANLRQLLLLLLLFISHFLPSTSELPVQPKLSDMLAQLKLLVRSLSLNFTWSSYQQQQQLFSGSGGDGWILNMALVVASDQPRAHFYRSLPISIGKDGGGGGDHDGDVDADDVNGDGR